MSDHPEQLSSGEVAQRLYRQARLRLTSAVLYIARATGARVISEQVWPGMASVADYAEPGSGLRIARALEFAAAGVTRDYVRHAREAGLSWHEIGVELGLREDSADPGDSIGDKAFQFAASAGSSPEVRDRRPSFTWQCPGCGELIRDYGPRAGTPPEQEVGHSADCPRMAARVAAWNDVR